MSDDIDVATEQAVSLLNLLDGIGLTGEKLACSLGSEEALAAQLTGEIGVELQDWHVEFVTAQVKAAVQMSDLERRVHGSASTSSMQMIADAVSEAGQRDKGGPKGVVQEAAVEVPRGELLVRA